MKNLVSIMLTVLEVVSLGQHVSSNAAPTSFEIPVEGKNFCTKKNGCICNIKVNWKDIPRPIVCSGIGLRVMYEQSDFLATFDALNLSMDATLNFHFNENKIQNIPRFPPMPIVLLSFRRNHISTIDAKAFSELTLLASLDLSYNKLTSEALNEGVFVGGYNESFGYFPLTQLQHLNLSSNNIRSLDKNAFDHLTELQTLDLSKNPLKVLGGSTSMAISSLGNLKYLGLAHVGVSTMHEGMLHDLFLLKALDLAGNFFTKVPQELRSAHGLIVLSLDGNKFETLDNESFIGLESLEDLSLRNNEKLKSVEEGTFGPLKVLYTLDLSFCKRLETLSDDAFLGITNSSKWSLMDIRLNDNGLSQINEALCPWDKVDYVEIQNNPFRCDCNLEWMLKHLVPKINLIKPSLTYGIKCAQPATMKGKRLVDLMIESELFANYKKCEYELFPEEINKIESISDGASENTSRSRDQYTKEKLIVGFRQLIISVQLLCIFGVSAVVFLVVKRHSIAQALVGHQDIRYKLAKYNDHGIGGIKSSAFKPGR